MAKARRHLVDLPPPDPAAGDRDEMNFAEFPIALLSDRPPAGVSSLEFADTIRDPQTGEMVTRRLTIDAPERFGLPTALDDEVILGLIQLTKLRNNFTDRSVQFSRYELIHLLGWPDSGPSYQRLEESLDRWVRVTLDYRRAWWCNRQKGWVDEKFHILERVSLFETDRPRGKQTVLPFSQFTWNEVVFGSFQAGYLKRLDLTFYLSLRHPTARRVYRFLDKRFYHRPRHEFDLTTFAFEHIGLSRSSCQTRPKGGKAYPSLSKVKEKLAPGLAELEARGFLEPLPAAERYAPVRRGEWRIVLVKQPAVVVSAPAPARQPPLVQALIGRGVTAKTAAELVAGRLAEEVERQLDVLDWLQQRPGGESVQNPGAWLAVAIRDGYAPPAGYKPKADRERQQQAVAAAAAQRQQEETAKRQQEAAEKAADRARRDHIAAYLKTLSTPARRDLEERAVAAGDEFQQRVIRQKEPGSGVLRQLLVEQEVLRVHPLE